MNIVGNQALFTYLTFQYFSEREDDNHQNLFHRIVLKGYYSTFDHKKTANISKYYMLCKRKAKTILAVFLVKLYCSSILVHYVEKSEQTYASS